MCRGGIFFHKRRSLVNFVCYQEYTIVVNNFFGAHSVCSTVKELFCKKGYSAMLRK